MPTYLHASQAALLPRTQLNFAAYQQAPVYRVLETAYAAGEGYGTSHVVG
jgi:hypothetical protein